MTARRRCRSQVQREGQHTHTPAPPPAPLAKTQAASEESEPAQKQQKQRQSTSTNTQVEEAASSNPPDILTLRQIAFRRHGFQTAANRASAWSALLGIKQPVTNITIIKDTSKLVHDYQRQVPLDINRSLWHVEDEEQRASKRIIIARLIHNVLAKYRNLHYYQGFHDVVSAIYLELSDEQLTYNLLCRLCQCHLLVFMQPSMDDCKPILALVMVLLRIRDPPLHAHLEKSGISGEFFVAWILTWFTHTFTTQADIARILDVCIASHPYFIVYLSAMLLAENRTPIMATEADLAAVYSRLSKVTLDNIESIIAEAGSFFNAHPPEAVIANRHCQYKKELRSSQQIRNYRSLCVQAMGPAENRCDADTEFHEFPPPPSSFLTTIFGSQFTLGSFSPTTQLVGVYSLIAIQILIWAWLQTRFHERIPF